MSNEDDAPRRVRVERNIYQRSTGVYEVGFKDGSGRQRWRTVEGGITAARAVRDELVAQRRRGQRVADNARLRLDDAANAWLSGPVVDLQPATRQCDRNAVEQHLAPRFASRRLDAVSPDGAGRRHVGGSCIGTGPHRSGPVRARRVWRLRYGVARNPSVLPDESV